MKTTRYTRSQLNSYVELNADIQLSVEQFMKREKWPEKYIEFYSQKLIDLLAVEKKIKEDADILIKERTERMLEYYDDVGKRKEIELNKKINEYEEKIQKFNPVLYLQSEIFNRFVKGGCDKTKAAYSTALILADTKEAREARAEIGHAQPTTAQVSQ